MKKFLFLTATVVSTIGVAFGYGDSDEDSAGHKYNDTDYYVQCQGWAGGNGNWEPGYPFDKGGTWSTSSTTTFWSTGVGPNQYPDMDYYINGGKQLYFQANSGYAKAPFYDTFQGHSLTVGAHGQIRLNGSESAVNYPITIEHLYLRPTSVIYEWADTSFCFGAGEMTVLSEDENYPAVIVAGRTGCCYYFKNNLIGNENAQLLLEGTLEKGKYNLGDEIGTMEFLGDNSEYYGRISVGCDMTLRIGNGGFPNATIDVNGKSTNNYNAYPISETNVEYTSVGVCATDGEKPVLAELMLADGVTLECSGMVDNGNGFYIYGYTQEGHVTLDFGGKLLTKKLEILQVAADTGSTELDASRFTVKNITNEGCELAVKTDPETGDQLLVLLPDGSDYVTLEKNDTPSWSQPIDVNLFSYYGAGNWSDGQAPHEDADYLVSGSGIYLYMPIAYVVAKDATGRTSGYADFYGGSLTLSGGGSFRPASYKYNVTATDFQINFKDLRLAPGGYICQYDGNDTTIFSSKGKITISGTDDTPAYISCGSKYDVANNYRMFINSSLAGSGALVLTGGVTWEEKATNHWVQLNGDNTAFTGTVRAERVNDATIIDERARRCNIEVFLGASGLPNGSLFMNDSEARLGISKSATGGLVPIMKLSLCEGSTLDVGSMMTNNSMRGFVVTESYSQAGVVTVDVANVTASARTIDVLRIATSAGMLDVDDFKLVNEPDAKAYLKITAADGYQTLQIYNPDAETAIPVELDNNTRYKLVTKASPGDVLDPSIYVMTNTTFADLDTDWYRFYSEGDSLYVENYKCVSTNLYDVYMTTSDYHCTNEVTKLQNESFLQGQNWSDKMAPHAGSSYINFHENIFLISEGAQSFGGDLLVLATHHWNDNKACSETFLRADTYDSEIYVNELRVMDNAILHTPDCTNYVLRGTMRILSTDFPAYLYFGNAKAQIHLSATILGGATRVFGTRINGADSGAACTRTVWLDGDASEYKGTLYMTNTFMLAVGSYGLPKGTAKMSTATAGITSADAKKAVEVGTLKMAAGSWIQVKTSTYGINVQHLALEGQVQLDFGSRALAQDITVLTVPSTETLTTSMFTVPTPLAGYSLAVISENGTKRLVYSSATPPKTEGAAILLR